MSKKSYRLGDVCRLLDLQPYVLRYWATEFPLLRGEEGANGANRVYSETELALLRRIKGLLYEEGYTIAGAKKKLEQEPLALDAVAAAPLFAADESVAPDEEAPVALDTPDDEQIKTLRRGLTAALKEARAILALLQSRK